MHCYGDQLPSEHLEFGADGSVQALGGSQYGFETIRTVNLDRDSLRQQRRAVAEDVFECIRQFAEGDESQQAEAIQGLRRLGNKARPFAGVARAIVEWHVEMTWEDFIGVVTPTKPAV